MIKSIKMSTLAVGLSFASVALPCSPDGKDGFLPENNYRIPVTAGRQAGGITEAQFNALIDKAEAVYAPIVANLGGKLLIERNWADATVNAYASQAGSTWKVAMFGGLARHKAITVDGMSLVVCHEIGHHIGGAPKKAASWSGSSWASNEGQADYFATLKCLRKVFAGDTTSSYMVRRNASRTIVEGCKQATRGNPIDTDLCIRTSMAGKSVADLFSDLGKEPITTFETPDPKVVIKTNDNHPKAQCRLDTYYQGSLCDIGDNEDVSQTDEVKGTCHPSLGHKVGARPLCWFKPKG